MGFFRVAASDGRTCCTVQPHESVAESPGTAQGGVADGIATVQGHVQGVLMQEEAAAALSVGENRCVSLLGWTTPQVAQRALRCTVASGPSAYGSPVLCIAAQLLSS